MPLAVGDFFDFIYIHIGIFMSLKLENGIKKIQRCHMKINIHSVNQRKLENTLLERYQNNTAIRVDYLTLYILFFISKCQKI